MDNTISNTNDILIAEDDHEDVLIFEWGLAELDISFRLRHANTADELFLLLQQKIPDMLFLDVHLPTKNGIDCLRQLREDDRLQNVPIIMLTANHSPALINNAYEAGATLFMNKPFDFVELSKKLKQISSIDWTAAPKRFDKQNFFLA